MGKSILRGGYNLGLNGEEFGLGEKSVRTPTNLDRKLF
jgi:hypothetical protein